MFKSKHGQGYLHIFVIFHMVTRWQLTVHIVRTFQELVASTEETARRIEVKITVDRPPMWLKVVGGRERALPFFTRICWKIKWKLGKNVAMWTERLNFVSAQASATVQGTGTTFWSNSNHLAKPRPSPFLLLDLFGPTPFGYELSICRPGGYKSACFSGSRDKVHFSWHTTMTR